MFVVPVKTPVHIRVVGSPLWVEWTTTKDCHFGKYQPIDNGGYWVFEKDGWEMRVRPQFVEGRKKKNWNGLGNSTDDFLKRREPRGTFNKCILGRNVRGARRRRNRR